MSAVMQEQPSGRGLITYDTHPDRYAHWTLRARAASRKYSSRAPPSAFPPNTSFNVSTVIADATSPHASPPIPSATAATWNSGNEIHES